MIIGSKLRCGVLLGSLILASGCAHSGVRTAQLEPVHQQIDVEMQKIVASPDPDLGTKGFNAEELFYEGQKRFTSDELAGAAEVFERVLNEFPESRYVAPALLMRGTALLKLSRPDEATAMFERYMTRYPTGTQRWYALKGLGDAHADQKDWARSEADFVQMAALNSLTALQREAALAGRGRALIEQGRLDEADPLIREVAERRGPSSRTGDGSIDARELGAMARFYVGELTRRRSEAIRPQAGVDLDKLDNELETKAELLISAHEQYYRTFAYGVPTWTAAAAYQMGYLYERFYQDLMEAPPPADLDAEAVALYREMLDSRLANVVKRAKDLYGQVVRHAARLQLEDAWVQKCQAGIARLESRIGPATPGAPVNPPPSPAPAPKPAPPTPSEHI